MLRGNWFHEALLQLQSVLQLLYLRPATIIVVERLTDRNLRDPVGVRDFLACNQGHFLRHGPLSSVKSLSLGSQRRGRGCHDRRRPETGKLFWLATDGCHVKDVAPGRLLIRQKVFSFLVNNTLDVQWHVPHVPRRVVICREHDDSLRALRGVQRRTLHYGG